MRVVYEAAHSVEAHLVVNYLAQEGVPSRIHGEYLQGGMGELQALGLVQVLVTEADYPQAQALIARFEADNAEATALPDKTAAFTATANAEAPQQVHGAESSGEPFKRGPRLSWFASLPRLWQRLISR